MPIPKPKAGEKQREYIQRCLIQTSKEYKRDKALAICYDAYRNR